MAQVNNEQPLQASTILANQENTWEQKIISKNDFNMMVQEYTESLNEKFKEKAFINKDMYKDIIKLLSDNDNTLHDSGWRSWVRNNFTLDQI